MTGHGYLFWSFVIVLIAAWAGWVALAILPDTWLARWLGDS
jgi:hypothetical protein